MEEKCVSDFFAVLERENDLGLLPVEDPFLKRLFIGDNFVLQLFIVRQFFYKFKN